MRQQICAYVKPISSIAIIFFSTMQRLGKITLRALHYLIFFSS